jgi:hypothetical protein
MRILCYLAWEKNSAAGIRENFLTSHPSPCRAPRRVKTNEMCAYINEKFHLNTFKDELSTINNLHALHRRNIKDFFSFCCCHTHSGYSEAMASENRQMSVLLKEPIVPFIIRFPTINVQNDLTTALV